MLYNLSCHLSYAHFFLPSFPTFIRSFSFSVPLLLVLFTHLQTILNLFSYRSPPTHFSLPLVSSIFAFIRAFLTYLFLNLFSHFKTFLETLKLLLIYVFSLTLSQLSLLCSHKVTLKDLFPSLSTAISSNLFLSTILSLSKALLNLFIFSYSSLSFLLPITLSQYLFPSLSYTSSSPLYLYHTLYSSFQSLYLPLLLFICLSSFNVILQYLFPFIVCCVFFHFSFSALLPSPSQPSNIFIFTSRPF